MNINQKSAHDRSVLSREFHLNLPSKAFRLGWLLAGLVVGYVASGIHVSSIWPLLFITALAGVSGNWTA